MELLVSSTASSSRWRPLRVRVCSVALSGITVEPALQPPASGSGMKLERCRRSETDRLRSETAGALPPPFILDCLRFLCALWCWALCFASKATWKMGRKMTSTLRTTIE
eukprot:3933541-Rhodomonas_salina.3